MQNQTNKRVSNTQVSYMSYLHKGDVARDGSYVPPPPAPGSQLRRFLAQQSVSTSLRHCFERIQHCSGITTLCCPKNRRCESSPVTSPWVPHKNFLRQDTLTIINNYAWFLYVCYSYTIISKAALKTVGPSQRQLPRQSVRSLKSFNSCFNRCDQWTSSEQCQQS